MPSLILLLKNKKMLKLKNVSYAINSTEIVNNISFEILPGEIVSILGASGAWKSTLFKLLTRELRPTLGKIMLDNLTLDDLSFDSIQQYRRQIGVIFQDYKLLNQKTVFENISFALEVCGKIQGITEKVEELLKLVGLLHKKNNFPTILSGGEKQGVAIARALVHNPQILIADEATGNLDPKNSREISELFLKLNKEKNITMLMSTHDQILVQQLSPRIIRLEQGSILFDKKNISKEDAFYGLL